MAHAIVRLDNLSGTKDPSQLKSIKITTEMDNGLICSLNGRATKTVGGETIIPNREVWAIAEPDADKDIYLIASVELMYDERKHNLNEFVNVTTKPARAYRLHSGDCFSVTAEAIDGTPVKGAGVTVPESGYKITVAGDGDTAFGTITDVEVVGADTYYVIDVA